MIITTVRRTRVRYDNTNDMKRMNDDMIISDADLRFFRPRHVTLQRSWISQRDDRCDVDDDASKGVRCTCAHHDD